MFDKPLPRQVQLGYLEEVILQYDTASQGFHEVPVQGTETTYESLLSLATEAEAQWLENKSIKAKVASFVDPGRKESDELKAMIDKLLAELAKKEKRVLQKEASKCSFNNSY